MYPGGGRQKFRFVDQKRLILVPFWDPKLMKIYGKSTQKIDRQNRLQKSDENGLRPFLTELGGRAWPPRKYTNRLKLVIVDYKKKEGHASKTPWA